MRDCKKSVVFLEDQVRTKGADALIFCFDQTKNRDDLRPPTVFEIDSQQKVALRRLRGQTPQLPQASHDPCKDGRQELRANVRIFNVHRLHLPCSDPPNVVWKRRRLLLFTVTL